jgi:Ricin-type beta-trefoil lectin domain
MKKALLLAAVVPLAAVALCSPARATITQATGAQTAQASAPGGTPIYAFNSQRVLAVPGNAKSGTKVVIAADSAAKGRSWELNPDGTIRPAYDTRLCLNVPAARYRPGVQLTVAACASVAREHFGIRRPSAHTPVMFIYPRGASKLCLTATGYFNAGSAVVLGRCAGLDSQGWATTNLAYTQTPGDVVSSVGTMGPDYATVLAGNGTLRSIGVPFGVGVSDYWQAVTTGSWLQVGSEIILRSVVNTTRCLTLSGPEAVGTGVSVRPCSSLPSQRFIGVQVSSTAGFFWGMVLSHDARYCLTTRQVKSERSAVLGRCAGGAADQWWTSLSTSTETSGQYADLFVGNNGEAQYAMGVVREGASGAKVVITSDVNGNLQSGRQIWTDIRAGSAHAGNPDGSMSLRPLYNLSLCLAVPNGTAVPGTQLEVRTCDGATDQEFVRAVSTANPVYGETYDVIMPEGSALCVGVPAIKTSQPVQLQSCAQTGDQAWSVYLSWFDWAG